MTWELNDRQIDSVTLIDVVGRLETSGGSDALEEKLQALIRQGQRSLLLECSRVSAIDSSGIGALVRAYTSCKQRGGHCRVFGLQKRVLQTLKMVRLDALLEIADDEAAALAGLRQRAALPRRPCQVLLLRLE